MVVIQRYFVTIATPTAMRQLLYTFGFIMLLLAAFLGVWWTQRYQSSLDTLRDQVESEMNLLISDSYLIKTFQIIRSDTGGGVGGNGFRLRPRPEKPIVMMGNRQGQINRDGERTTIVVSNARDGISEVEIIVDETGFSLAELPTDVRDSISRKFRVGLDLPPTSPLNRFPDRFRPRSQIRYTQATEDGPVVWARNVNNHAHNKEGTMFYLSDYRPTILFGMLPEFLLGLVLFGATGFAFASAYRNLYEKDQQLRQKDALVANVAHELKTPIATVGVALEALNLFGVDADPVRRREYLAIGQAELQRLDQMADRAIDTLQAGDLHQRLSLVKTDLTDSVHDAWRGLSLRYRLPEDALTLTSYGDVRTAVDRHYWHHLVYNLLDNACKYGDRPLQVAINVAGQAYETVFTITDNGPGIPARERENIFERFYRINRPGEGHSVKGHGLGLSFVRQVANAHGGTVEVDNTQEGGARFTVKIPHG